MADGDDNGRATPEPANQEEADGLDVDEHQSQEIREIFGTTFPQYLLPVEEIIEQLLGGKGDPGSIETLRGMISSLMKASARMGFADVNSLLDRLLSRVSSLERPGQVAGEVRDGLLQTLADLKALSAQMANRPEEEAEQPKQTIFNALKDKEGIGEIALRRLAAAGLITVDQVLMAKAGEIVAVTGLDARIVNHIIALLRGDQVLPLTPTPAPMLVAPPPASDELQGAHERVLTSLRSEGTVEAELERLRGEVEPQRERVAAQRAQLRAQDRELKAACLALGRQAREEESGRASLEHLKVKREQLARRCAELTRAAAVKQSDLEQLESEQRQLEEQASRLRHEVNGLLAGLSGIRKRAR